MRRQITLNLQPLTFNFLEERAGHAEGGTFTHHTVYRNFPSLRFDEFLDQRQAQSPAVVLAGCIGCNLVAAFKDVGQFICRDADACIRYLQPDTFGILVES